MGLTVLSTGTIVIDFRRLRGVDDVPAYLGCSPEIARILLDGSTDAVFIKHRIPKPGKLSGHREVWEVQDRRIAEVYKGLCRQLDAFLRQGLAGFPHRAAHGYLRKRSTLSNATAHLGARAILKGDIQAFFRSISAAKVTELLLKADLPAEAAGLLTQILVWDNHVPLGLHTSPLLANAVCHALDAQLSALVPGGTFTRYADDLSFSGPSLPSRGQVEVALGTEGFTLAPKKWRLVRRGRGLYVTGLSLEDVARPRVPRHIKRRLRQELHYASKYGLNEHIGRRYSSLASGVNKIHGTIQYVRGIERDLGRTLQSCWAKTLGNAGLDVRMISHGPNRGRPALFLLDESVTAEGPDGRTMALALVIVEDLEHVGGALKAFFEDLAARPYPSTAVEVLEAEGLHWNRLSQDDRTRTVDRLAGLPFRAFVAYGALRSEDKKTYATLYERLLRVLLKDRFVRYAGCSIELKAETNDRIASTLLGKVTADLYQTLVDTNARRPETTPTCLIAGKQSDPVLPMPDLVLGVFGEYALSEIRADSAAQKKAGKDGRKQGRSPGAQSLQRFDQVRDKIKAIYDVDGSRVFSRRNPLVPWPVAGRKPRA